MDPQTVKTPVTGSPRIVSSVKLEDAWPELMTGSRDNKDFVALRVSGMPWIYDSRPEVVRRMKVIAAHEGDGQYDTQSAFKRLVEGPVSGPAYVRINKVTQADGKVTHTYNLFGVNEGAVADEASAFSVIFVEGEEDETIFEHSNWFFNLRSQANGTLVITLTGVDHPAEITTKDKKWLLTDKVEVTDIPMSEEELKSALGIADKGQNPRRRPQPEPQADEPAFTEGDGGETVEATPIATSFGESDISIAACLGDDKVKELAESCVEAVGASN